jgi:hypothetical protein
MKKLSYLLIVLIGFATVTMTGCASTGLMVRTHNAQDGTDFYANRTPSRAMASYVPRSFTGHLEAGSDGVNMVWVGNPDSAALVNWANAKAHQDLMWEQEIAAMKIDNALRARETLPGAVGSSAKIFIDNQAGYWAWIKDGDNSGFNVCPTQGVTLRLPPGSRPHFSIYILKSKHLNPKHTPTTDQIIGSYTEDDWIVPGTDNWISVGATTRVNGVYTITWPHASSHAYVQPSSGDGNHGAWSWWNQPDVRAHW